jgi:hypothetical protein
MTRRFEVVQPVAFANETEAREQIAQEYREEGWEVILAPDKTALPDFLKLLPVAMVARKEGEGVVIAFRTHDQLASSSLKELSEAVDKQPDWTMDLVVTDRAVPKPTVELDAPLSAGEITEFLTLAEELLARGKTAAADTLAWKATGGTLRLVARHFDIALDYLDTLWLIKQLFSEGCLSRAQYDALRAQIIARRDAAEANQEVTVEVTEVQNLIQVAREIWRDNLGKQGK